MKTTPRPKRKSKQKPGDAHAKTALESLRRIVRSLRLHDREAERALGISVAQLFVIQLLADNRPRSISELADATLTDMSSVSVVVRRLVERGLVERSASADDARRAEIRLTLEGKALLRRAPEAPQARLVAALATLPPDDRVVLARSLSAVADAMGAREVSFFFENE